MKLNLLNQVFSFHDFHLTNVENFSGKIILYFDQGIYFEKMGDTQKDYMMTNPRLLLHKTDTSFSKEELGEIIGGLIQTFDPDFDLDGGLEDLDDDFDHGVEINLYKDGAYKKISIDEFLKLNFEIINESFGYGYMRFYGLVTGFRDIEKWQDASLEVYYNNDAELIYDDLEELN